MIYGSVCSGIEAATVAWHPLGWKPSFFAEIDKFPSAVLAHHYPKVPNLGDFTQITPDQHEPIDLLVGGTPCQSFSIAGLRGGMADARGNLALEFLRLADRARPRWLVWENVPGVLSSNGGRDFGAILGGMVELGYGIAYRVLDAQYVRVGGFWRAVPQRRRRVFVVGYLGDWRRAAAVLFERACLLGDPAPRREAGERVAGTFSAGAHPGSYNGQDAANDLLVAHSLRAQAQASHRADSDNYVAHALRADGFDASEDGTGRGTPIVPISFGGQMSTPMWDFDLSQTIQAKNPQAIAFSSKDHGADAGEVSPTLRSMNFDKSHANAGGQVAVAFQPRIGRNGRGYEEEVVPALNGADAGATSDMRPCVAFVQNSRDEVRLFGDDGQTVGAALAAEPGMKQQSYVATSWAVRRLTPTECEALQGFPRGYTNIPWRGKSDAPDGPRYKALGNSMACNVMRWIGTRIAMVDKIP